MMTLDAVVLRAALVVGKNRDMIDDDDDVIASTGVNRVAIV